MKITAWDEITDTKIIPERFPNEGEWSCTTTIDDLGRIITNKQEYYNHIELNPETRAIRNITKGAFWTRVTIANRAELLTRAKSDVLMEAQLLTITDSEYINLDDVELRAGFTALVDSIITQEDFDRIFADGIESEVPELLRY